MYQSPGEGEGWWLRERQQELVPRASLRDRLNALDGSSEKKSK